MDDLSKLLFATLTVKLGESKAIYLEFKDPASRKPLMALIVCEDPTLQEVADMKKLANHWKDQADERVATKPQPSDFHGYPNYFDDGGEG